MVTRPPAVIAALALLAGVALSGCGSSAATTGVPEPSPDRQGAATPQPERPHALPRWVPTASFQGPASLTSDLFGIVPDALQWKVSWQCSSGRLRIATIPPARTRRPLVDSACPGTGEGYATQRGQTRLAVTASGPWTAAVAQEVDAPLDEPPLAAMGAPGAQVLASGALHPVDRPGTGEVTLYRLAGGGLALRLTDFDIPINTDLYVWAEPVQGLTTSAQMLAAPHVVIAPLKSTTGNQNYGVTGGVGPEQMRSVVIWCLVQQFAYVAADLQPAA